MDRGQYFLCFFGLKNSALYEFAETHAIGNPNVFLMLFLKSYNVLFLKISCFAISNRLWKIKEFLQERSDFR